MSYSHVGLCCLAILLAAPPSTTASGPGLLAHWKFDGCQGDRAEDSSGTGNTAEISGAEWAKGGHCRVCRVLQGR
jgi:hypothetical protein